MAVRKKFSALGRGLDALISTEDVVGGGSKTISDIDINDIQANPNQPRREFNEEALQELTDSIREIGIIQPITLRDLNNGKYQIIAGERRWRAAMRAQLKTIPAYIRTVSDESLMEMALVENIQRQDLNPIEIALAYQSLIEQYGLTQEKLADKVGKKRTTVANFIRLLRLPAPVQMGLKDGSIDTGHARALIAIEDPVAQVKTYNDIVKNKWSVRMVENYVKKLKNGQTNIIAKKQQGDDQIQQQEIDDVKNALHQFFGTNVQINVNAKGKGKITIAFKHIEELKNLVKKLK